jgi:phytoene dehydrogenase-like protein
MWVHAVQEQMPPLNKATRSAKSGIKGLNPVSDRFLKSPPRQEHNSPSGPGRPHYRGFTITIRYTPKPVGLIWTGDQSDAATSTWQHKHSQGTDIHAPSWIRTRNPSMRAAADPSLRPRGHWDRLFTGYISINPYGSSTELDSTALSAVPGPMPSLNRQFILQCFTLIFPNLHLSSGCVLTLNIKDFL